MRLTCKTLPRESRLLIVGLMLLLIEAPLAWAQAAPATAAALSANELAKEISNPVTSLWQLQFQFNNLQLESSDLSPVSERWVNNLYFQPVMPVSLTKDWNLVTRPVITVYQSVPYPTATGSIERTTHFGDTILAQVLSPAGTEPWIWGVGPTWIFRPPAQILPDRVSGRSGQLSEVATSRASS